jgi:hypothetical protein
LWSYLPHQLQYLCSAEAERCHHDKAVHAAVSEMNGFVPIKLPVKTLVVVRAQVSQETNDFEH